MADTEHVTRPRLGLFLCVLAESHYEDPPCAEAFRARVPETERRRVSDPKKIPEHRGTDGDWYTVGTNHRVVDGRICRDVGTRDDWVVDLPDIQALLAFVDKYRWCGISRDNNGFYTIEIREN